MIDITSVVQALGISSSLKHYSRYWNGPCPICHTKKLKFYIYPNYEKHKPGWFRCYRGSCNSFGDSLQLIRLIENLNFGQAVARLATIGQINLGKLQTLNIHGQPEKLTEQPQNTHTNNSSILHKPDIDEINLAWNLLQRLTDLETSLWNTYEQHFLPIIQKELKH